VKSLLPILIVLWGSCPLSVWAQSSTPEEFIAAYRIAVQEKDPDKIKALTYSVGMSDYDQQEVAKHLNDIFNDKEIAAITLEPMQAKLKPQNIINGRKLEPTYPSAGVVKIQYKPVISGTTTTTSASYRPYAIIDGHYFFVPMKTTEVSMQIYSLGPGSDSADNKYRIVVVKEGDPGSEILVYGIMKSDLNKVILTIPCTYKMGNGDDDWALQSAQAAEVYWAKNGLCFVLNEENHQLMGNAILGTILESSGSITTHTFVPGDLQMRDFAKWRIRVNKGWISPTTLSLELTGTKSADGANAGATITQDFICEVDDASHYRFTKVQ